MDYIAPYCRGRSRAIVVISIFLHTAVHILKTSVPIRDSHSLLLVFLSSDSTRSEKQQLQSGDDGILSQYCNRALIVCAAWAHKVDSADHPFRLYLELPVQFFVHHLRWIQNENWLLLAAGSDSWSFLHLLAFHVTATLLSSKWILGKITLERKFPIELFWDIWPL